MSFSLGTIVCHEHLFERRFAGGRKSLYQLDHERWFAQLCKYICQATESMNYTIAAGRTYLSLKIKQKHKAKSKHTHNREILSEPSESTSKENQRHVFILSTKSPFIKAEYPQP